jgi:hypothetical protein
VGNSTEGLTLVKPKGEAKVTGVREGDGINVDTIDKKNDSKPSDQSSNSGKSDNSDSSNNNSSDSNKGSDTSTDNKADGQGSNDKGGFYTEDQWYAKHEARVEEQWQRAFEKLIRDIPPNVDPRQDQDEEKYLQKLDAAFSAAIREHLSKPDVDPFPPDFTDSTRARQRKQQASLNLMSTLCRRTFSQKSLAPLRSPSPALLPPTCLRDQSLPLGRKWRPIRRFASS